MTSQDSEDSVTSEASEPSFASETERMFEATRHSKTETRRVLPFEKHWRKRDAKPDKEYVVESNAYERALLKYVAAMRGISVRALVREYVREAALREALGGKAFR